MERGDGCYLYDVDGRRYIDFTNHHTAQILGHNHTVVNSAIKAQVSRGIALGAPTGIEVELAEEMCRRVPSSRIASASVTLVLKQRCTPYAWRVHSRGAPK